MDYNIFEIIEKGSYVPTFVEVKDRVDGEQKRTTTHAYIEDGMKLLSLDVRARASIGNALPYEIYRMV